MSMNWHICNNSEDDAEIRWRNGDKTKYASIFLGDDGITAFTWDEKRKFNTVRKFCKGTNLLEVQNYIKKCLDL